MISSEALKQKLRAGSYDPRLRKLYVSDHVSRQAQRLVELVDRYEACFGAGAVALFSAPGRTELGGNHTDHQHGRVLAASVNVDMIACAAPNGTDQIQVHSDGFPDEAISIGELIPKMEEVNTTSALIRGIGAAMKARGYTIGGFNAFVMSDVLPGSGLSSSAAYETLIGQIFNHLFCGDELDAIEIAKIGQYAENVYFGKPCGLMDQIATSVGSIVAVDFADPKEPVVQEISFPFAECGHDLCIVDVGADHADLTHEYAAVPEEMSGAARLLGKEVLRDVPEEVFFQNIPLIREELGDRAVLRAAHFYGDDKRARMEADALREGDFHRFCQLSRESGRSSFEYLQNVYPSGAPQNQAISIALMLAEWILEKKGAFRVHGGGFAGTIQAFVPNDMIQAFTAKMEEVFGTGMCHVLRIRPVGGVVLTKGEHS
ncbi:galactokinase [Clostridiales bacterium]|nr:galactokinase [Clostridiales bacterium]